MASTTPSFLTRRPLLALLLAILFLLISIPVLFPSTTPDLTYFRPKPHNTVTFKRNPLLFDLSPSANGNWTSLLPPNGGFVVGKNDFGAYEMVGITMFHQLHCLGMIREAILELMDESPMAPMDHELGDRKHGLGSGFRRRHGPHLDQAHWVHCLDYLVQGILCSADGTIERAHDSGDGEGRRVDGYEVTHQCRSPDALWSKVMGDMSLPGWYELGILAER